MSEQNKKQNKWVCPGAERGAALFHQGCNCAQSVFCAFSDQLGMDRNLAMRMSASFGGGIGRMREVCGAVSGMALIAGFFTGSTVPEDQEAKGANYQLVQDLAQELRAEHATILCRELLGLTEVDGVAMPEARTEQYYASRPCETLIRHACAIIEEHFPQLRTETEEGAPEES